MYVHGNILEPADRGPFPKKRRHGKGKLILHIKETVLRRTYGDYTKDYFAGLVNEAFMKRRTHNRYCSYHVPLNLT